MYILCTNLFSFLMETLSLLIEIFNLISMNLVYLYSLGNSQFNFFFLFLNKEII